MRSRSGSTSSEEIIALAKGKGYPPGEAALSCLAVTLRLAVANEAMPYGASIVLATPMGLVRGMLTLGPIENQGEPQ